MSDHLLRRFAPISDAAWESIDAEAKARLEPQLAARRFVDFAGPSGWQHSAVDLGRTTPVESSHSGITAAQRVVLPLVEMRAPFTLARSELDAVDRGAEDPDFSALSDAAGRLAHAENEAVFQGLAAAGIVGLAEASSHDPISITGNVDHAPATVATAVDTLRKSGIGGPYALALTPDVYTEIVETTEHGGYPLFEHLRQILGGPIVWAPGAGCGVVASQRGGDFVFESGQDIAIGYADHDADGVTLYLVESFAFRVVESDAAVALHRQ